MKKAWIGIAIFCFGLSLASGVYGAVWYVHPSGSDANTGQSWDEAFATVQQAVGSASDGDEIWVAAGTYLTPATITIGAKAIALYGGFEGNETSRE